MKDQTELNYSLRLFVLVVAATVFVACDNTGPGLTPEAQPVVISTQPPIDAHFRESAPERVVATPSVRRTHVHTPRRQTDSQRSGQDVIQTVPVLQNNPPLVVDNGVVPPVARRSVAVAPVAGPTAIVSPSDSLVLPAYTRPQRTELFDFYMNLLRRVDVLYLHDPDRRASIQDTIIMTLMHYDQKEAILAEANAIFLSIHADRIALGAGVVDSQSGEARFRNRLEQIIYRLQHSESNRIQYQYSVTNYHPVFENAGDICLSLNGELPDSFENISAALDLHLSDGYYLLERVYLWLTEHPEYTRDFLSNAFYGDNAACVPKRNEFLLLWLRSRVSADDGAYIYSHIIIGSYRAPASVDRVMFSVGQLVAYYRELCLLNIYRSSPDLIWEQNLDLSNRLTTGGYTRNEFSVWAEQAILRAYRAGSRGTSDYVPIEYSAAAIQSNLDVLDLF